MYFYRCKRDTFEHNIYTTYIYIIYINIEKTHIIYLYKYRIYVMNIHISNSKIIVTEQFKRARGTGARYKTYEKDKSIFATRGTNVPFGDIPF